jgi:hypothetical protein
VTGKAALIDRNRVVRVVSASDLNQFTADVARWVKSPAPADNRRCLACHTKIPGQ